ncbi:DUF421 domain-containing protein [Massilia rhizosphaerae]|uniref:DUF421 domain-containing protein n=1 Tax=Massilia rhizosphaerae TaxID=2784389 RepID=UPI0018DD0355|nr:YetF domain-containing protein [Massilia rhizosphaerae]
MFFDGWDSIVRVAVVGVLAYAGLVVMLRMSGNRTLSKMNAFDLVVTVAFGSTLSTILVNRNVSLATGLAAIALLVALQFVITWTAVRWRFVGEAIKTAPTLVVRDGRFLDDAMTRVRVTASDVRSAVRKHGIGAMEQVAAVVLESDGSLSVISVQQVGSQSACTGVRGAAGSR